MPPRLVLTQYQVYDLVLDAFTPDDRFMILPRGTDNIERY